jgi:hypothetical protein
MHADRRRYDYWRSSAFIGGSFCWIPLALLASLAVEFLPVAIVESCGLFDTLSSALDAERLD